MDPLTKTCVCKLCGMVINEYEFEAAAFDSARQEEPSFNLKYKQRFWTIYNLIKLLCSKFSLSNTVYEQACNLVELLYETKSTLVDRGRRGRLAAGASIYFVNQKSSNRAPLSLGDLASALDENLLGLGTYIMHIRKEAPDVVENNWADPMPFAERYITQGFQPLLERKRLKLPSEASAIALAKNLMSLGSMAWLDTGRRPEPFAFACTLLAIESCIGMKSAVSLKRADKETLSNSFGISYRTALSRYEELRNFILKESKDLLPWDIDNKSLLLHLQDAAKILLITIEDTKKVIEPPAFIRSTVDEDSRKRKLREAKDRLKKMINGETNSPDSCSVDERELIIEKLILLGASDPEILECKNNRQLGKLLEMYNRFGDSDVDDA